MYNSLENLFSCVQDVETQAEKLVILTGKPGSGKSQFLRDAASKNKWQYVDCKDLVTARELSSVLPTEKDAAAVEAIQSVLCNYTADVLLLDRIQSLFDTSMGVNVMKVMKKLSEAKPVVVAWPGYHEDGKLNFKKAMSDQVISYDVKDVKLFTIDGK